MKKILLLFVMSTVFGTCLTADEQENKVASVLCDKFKKQSFFMKSNAAKKHYIDHCIEEIKQVCHEHTLDYENVIEHCLSLVKGEVEYYKNLDKDRHYGIGLSLLAVSALFGVCSYFICPSNTDKEKKEEILKKLYGKDISDAEFVTLYSQWRKIDARSEGAVGCGIMAVSCAFTGVLALYDKKYAQYYYQKYSFIQNRLEKYTQYFTGNLQKDLIESIRSHDSEAVKKCIERGADIHGKDDKEYTPLYYAAELGDVAIVELLISYGAHVQLTTNNGITPYNSAFDRGHTAVCVLLKEKNGYTVIDTVHCGDTQELQHYLVHDSKSIQDNMNLLFHKAVCKGNVTILELLVQQGAHVHGSWGRLTHLEAAIMSRQIQSIEFLIKQGADIHARGSDGWQPIHVAMIFPSEEVVKTLIAAGASLHSQTLDGSTPLRIIVSLRCSNPQIPCSEEAEKVITYLRSFV